MSVACGLTAYFYLENRIQEDRAAESREITRALFREASVEQVTPDGKIELSGDIRLSGEWGDVCDVVCSSIFSLPDVKSVTLKHNTPKMKRFTLHSKGQCDAA